MAKLEIENLHPIAGEATWDVAFPWLCCFVKKWRDRKERIRISKLIESGVFIKPHGPKRQKTFKETNKLRWVGLKQLREDGRREKLPNETRRYEAMQLKDKERRKELK